MLDIKWIRENPDALDRALANRGQAPQAAELIALDETRRELIVQVQAWQEQRNRLSKEIGNAKASRDEGRLGELMEQATRLASDITNAGGVVVERRTKQLNEALANVPNVPLEDVPIGRDELANVEYRRWGNKPDLAMPKEHFDLGEALGQMDTAVAAKLSGARFTVLKAGLARLERALGQFMLDLHTTEHGYTEVWPPLMVRDDAMFGTAQLPKFKSDQFQSIDLRLPNREDLSKEAFNNRPFVEYLKASRSRLLDEVSKKHVYMGDFAVRSQVTAEIFDNTVDAIAGVVAQQNIDSLLAAYDTQTKDHRRWLIPTAEVPLTNLVRESIVDEATLPLRYTALTPCFRSEAGAAGKDTRGMLRQHQFDKVELVSITTPEQSPAEHERMLTSAEAVLKRLGLHYRVMTLSTGDMGFAAQKTYDIEVWLPGQGTYREISSCSTCGDFQARRMQARFKGKDGKGTRLVHTLNGSGVAVGRALIAVMENYQNPDGSITVPDVLRPYMGGMERVGRSA